MSNPYAAAHPFHAGTSFEKCPKCGKCNRVDVTEQDGHNEREEYYCADCHHLLGRVKASISPRTMIVDDSHCAPAVSTTPPKGKA